MIIEAADSSEVKTAIRGSDNAIGYVGYSYIMRGDTRVISLDGVPPSIDNIRNGTYPLARELYFITLGSPVTGCKGLHRLCLEPGGPGDCD